MAVTIGSRISTPEDWTEFEPGSWECKGTYQGKYGPVTITYVCFGNRQCVICGEPIRATEGEVDKCKDCWHALERYRAGRGLGTAWRLRIKAWLQEQGEEAKT